MPGTDPAFIPVLILMVVVLVLAAACAGLLLRLRREKAQAQRAAALDALPDSVVVLSEANLVIDLNRAAEALFGVPASAARGQPAAHVLARLPRLLDALAQPAGEIPPVHVIEQEGSLRFYEIRAAAVPETQRQQRERLVVITDVTQRAAADESLQKQLEALRHAEAIFRQLVEDSGDIRYILNREGRFTYLSPGAARYLPGDLPEFIGMHYRDVIVLEDSVRLDDIFARALAGEIETFTFRGAFNDGTGRTLQARQQQLLHDGQVTGVQGVVTDITEQLEIEAALARRASQLAIVNDIGEKIAGLMALDGILESAARLIQVNFGYYHVALFMPDPARKELVMRAASGAFSSIFPANHRLKSGQGMVGWVADNNTMLLANDVRHEARYTNFFPNKVITRSELTVPILLRDELVGVLDIQSPLKNAFDDNDVRLMKTIADQIAIAIENARLYNEVLNQLKETERKENTLRIQRDLMLAINSATNITSLLDAALKILSVELNVWRAAVWLNDPSSGQLTPAASLGYPPNALEGLSAPDNAAPPQTARGARSQLCVPLIAGQHTSGLISLESDQPGAFTHDDMRLLTVLAGHLVIAIERARLFDEVEQARAELETRAGALEAANRGLREIDRLKSQFLTNVSHELRTPLNSIIGFSEILLDNLAGPLTVDQVDCVHTIYDSGKHLLALINDVLDFSKMETGHLVITPTQFNVAVLVDELRHTLQPLAAKKEQTLTFQLQPDLPPVTADRLRLKQVLINLLSNANKFTPQGGVIDVWCCTDDQDHILFCVADSGIGIRPEHHQVIFEEFRQVDGSMTREASGTGLGLAISKRIVELHHGQIWVESDLDRGARFYVRIPIIYQADMI